MSPQVPTYDYTGMSLWEEIVEKHKNYDLNTSLFSGLHFDLSEDVYISEDYDEIPIDWI